MTAPEIFAQIERYLMEDTRLSQALERLFADPLPPEFDPLQRLKTTEQSPVHHPEGNVWNHTMLVVDVAEVASLGLCDRLGRLHTDLAAEEANVRRFIQKCGR